jgi:hypothetical protein
MDPLHKRVGTYNVFRIHLLRFFKWLYAPNVKPKLRPKPAVINNIPRLKRNEISIYTPSDLWTQKEDLLFLKYCPSKRDKCYHAISRDSSFCVRNKKGIAKKEYRILKRQMSIFIWQHHILIYSRIVQLILYLQYSFIFYSIC